MDGSMQREKNRLIFHIVTAVCAFVLPKLLFAFDAREKQKKKKRRKHSAVFYLDEQTRNQERSLP